MRRAADEYENEMHLLQHRAKALQLVCAHDEPEATAKLALDEFLKAFQSSDGRSSTQPGDDLDCSRDATTSKLSHAPPCLGAQNLLTLAELQKLAKLAGSGRITAPSRSRKGLREYEGLVSKHFAAVGELLKSVRGAITDLYDARVLRQSEVRKRTKAMEQEAAKRARTLTGKQQKGAKAKEGPEEDKRPVFDAKHGDIPAVVALTEEKFAKMGPEDLSVPYLIRPAPTLSALLRSDDGLRKEVAENKAKFGRDINKVKGLRNVVQDASVREVLKNTMLSLCGEPVRKAMSVAGPDLLQTCCEPDFWMRMSGTTTGGPEKFYLPALRCASWILSNVTL